MIGRVFRWWQRRSLVSQVGSFATGLVLCSFAIGLALTGYNLLGAVVNELGRRAMSVARTVAQVEELRRNLGQAGGSGTIQPVVERMRLSTGVEYIVAFDMNRIRYADPLAERIGRPFEGGDEGPSLSQQEQVLQDQFAAVGARAVVSSFNTLYADVETGRIDGQENTPNNIYTRNLPSVQPFLTISDHGFLAYVVITRAAWWKGIDPALKEPLVAGLDEASRWVREHALAMNEEALAKLTASDRVQVYTLSPQEREALLAAFAPVYQGLEGRLGRRYLAQVLSSIGTK